MGVSARTKFLVGIRSGGRCAFPDCRVEIAAKADNGEFVITGEAAHIVAQEIDGPRGRHATDRSRVDEFENLVFLCEKHHKIVDAQPEAYPVERLKQLKADHEKWVLETLSKDQRFVRVVAPPAFTKDRVQSTLLPVSRIPLTVYTAHCDLDEAEVKGVLLQPSKRDVMLPFAVRESKLITFLNTREDGNPFSRAIDIHEVESHAATDWWKDPDLKGWYVTLLNRSLNKLTGRAGLNLDKDHGRYYFPPNQDGTARSVSYTSVGGVHSSRNVAWRPRFRHNGQEKPFWEHLAVSLRFDQVDSMSWCLSIRPERRFTKDGFTSLEPKSVGKRSNRRHSKLYNADVLKEVHFWREYLSRGTPRMLFHFGTQILVVENEMVSTEIAWPGVPDDAKPLKSVRHDDDLFSHAELEEALTSETDDLEWDDESPEGAHDDQE